MSTIINSKSKNPFYIQDNVASETPLAAYTATLYAESAGNIIVYAAPASAAVQVPINITIVGSGTNAGLKFFALAVNRSFTSATNSITLTNLSIGTVYGGPIVSTNANTAAIASKYLYTTVGPVTTITTAVVTGDTSITIENGKYGTIYGGGAGYGSKIIGDTTVKYYGGRVSTIYGGGGLGSVVDGDTNVNILGTSTVGSSIGTIYAGGNNSTVTGNTNVTFTSDSALINFKGVVYGGGAGANAIVKGSRNFIFDNYSGSFSGSIRGFTNIDFVGATSVTMLSKQDKSIVGATYNFAINDESLKNTNAMLIWNQNIKLVNNLKVTIDAGVLLKDGGDIDLIASKYFTSQYSFNKNQVLVINDNGDRVSSLVYTVNYIYDKKLGGEVSIDYKGTALTIDGTQTIKVVLTGSDEEVNIVKGGNLVAGLDTAGGNDIVNIQTGAIINGGIKTGAGDDTLYIQAGSTVNGYIDMGAGDDRLVVNRDATLTSDVTLGTGVNTLIVQNHAQISGTVILADGSTNNITINGGAVSSFAGGNSETTNNIVVNGARLLLPILGEIFVGGGIGYYQNLLPNSIDVSGIVGTDPVNLSLTLDQENWILANVFVAQDLNLGASNDNVTINSYAQVLNINLGAGDDKLVLNEDAIVRGDINLGAGQNTLVLNCGNVFNGRLIANEGTDVVVAGTSMALNGDFLSLGSTNNVLVVANGAIVNLSGVSVGRFLAVSDNQGIYLNQNAVVELTQLTPGAQFIQSYTGSLTSSDDVIVLAAPTVVPARVAEYYTAGTDGVVASQITTAGGFILSAGAKLTNSTVNADLDVALNGVVTDSTISNVNDVTSESFDINGTVTNSNLESDNELSVNTGATVTGGIIDVNGDAFVDGTVTGSTMYVDGDLDVDGLLADSTRVDVDGDVSVDVTGTIDNSTLQIDGSVFVDGAVTATTLNVAGDAVITGSVSDTALVLDETVGDADQVTFDSAAASFTGSITGAENVIFNYTFTSGDLTISTDEMTLAKNVVVNISSTDATAFTFGTDAMLIENLRNTVTILDVTKNVDFTPYDGFNISIRGFVTGDLTLSNNIVNLDDDGHGTFGDFVGKLILNGDNRLVVKSDIWYDWQQFVFKPTATLGFDLSESVLLAIDGFIGSDPMATVVNVTNFGQNSQLAIGSWVYIHDWKDMGDSTRSYELPVNNFPQGNVNNLAWDNLYVIAGSEIWGGIRLNDNANELVINDGVVVNGSNYFYDYGTIRTLGGDDTVTIGAAIINGRISTGDGADTMTLNGTTVNAAVNQGDAVVDMGAGDDVLDINTAQIGGDIALGDGNDTATITGSAINGNIDTGAGNDTLSIDPTTVNGNITLGAGDDTATIVDSTINGNIDLGAGTDEVTIGTSVVNGNIIGVDNNTLVIEATSTISGAVLLGAGNDDVTISNSVITGVVLPDDLTATAVSLGDGINIATITDSTVTGDILGGAGNDTLIIDPSTVIGNIDLGNGTNEATIIGSQVTGNVSLGDFTKVSPPTGTNTVTLDDSMIDGNLAFGQGATIDNILNAGNGSTVTGDVSFGWVDVDVTTVPPVITKYPAQSNTVNVTGDFAVAGDLDMLGLTNEVNLDETAHLTVGGDIVMTDLTANTINTHTYDTVTNAAVTVGAISNVIDATSLSMIGDANTVQFGVSAHANSDLSALHMPASIALNAVTMNLNAPVTMTNDVPDATNLMDNDLILVAEGESNVSANGAVAIGVTGEAVSMNGISNTINFGVGTFAGNWSGVGLYGHSGVQLNDVTMALNAPVSMINDLSGTVTGATNMLDMDFDLTALGDSDIAANGSVAIGANGDFVSLSGASNTINLGINAHADGEFYVPGKHAGIELNAVTMNLNGPITMDNNVDGTGAVNVLDMDYAFSTDADSDIVANGDMTTTLAGSAVSMTGTSNTILFGVDATADGEYVPSPIPLHKQSRIEIGAVSMMLAAPITMTNDISDTASSSNLLEMDYDLAASGEGDIVVSGDATVAVIGNVNMTANDNTLSALINFDAGVQSKVDVGSHNVALLINGDVTMRTVGDASNTIDLGYIKTEDIAVLPTDSDGQVIANGSYTVTVNGDILMAGIGATNTLTIEKNVTVTGAIGMGIVMGDTLSALNTLNLTDPGSFNGTTITMIAGTNVATLSGSGVLSETLSIYGGTNTLTVGANVTINDIVSFGGIYDKDAIGTEGYVILKNLANTINVFGIVNGIDTSIDLNAPVGVVNDSKDTITITGSSLGVLNVVNDIITGNGDDSIDIQGGNVGGDVTMGDRASGAVGKNRIRVAALKIPATLTTPELLIPASVAGSVSMESTTFNRIDVRGLFQVNTDGSHTATSASIGGNATMNALTYDAITGNLDESIGDNLLTMEETSIISGAVAMAAGKSNTMTVRTGEIDTFVGGPVGGTLQDSIASVASIKMVSAANSLSVDKGLLGTAEGTLNVTSVIAGTTNGISMTQDQAFRLRNPLSTYTNTITVEADGRLVLTSTSDILMGNTVNAAVQGAYTFDHVTLNPSHVEVYYFNWNGGTNENVYDTTLNTITDHGRMFADDVTMYAKTNVMTVDGGAGIINPAGEGAFDGGNITMQGGLLVGGGVLASESNTLTDTALFFSKKIDMYATSFNDLQITGETGLVPVPVGGYRSKVVGNVTMGTAAQVLVPAETGDNDALFVSTDVTGNIDMEALGARGDNSLKLTDSTVSGSVTTNAVAGSNTVNIDPSSVGTFVNMDAWVDNTLLVTGAADLFDVVTKSTIGTYADMSASTGSNTAIINMGSVGTDLTMNTHNSTTGNNSLTLNGYANPLNGHNVSKSTIGGNVSQTTAAIVDGNGNNTVSITNGDVTGNVTQDTFFGSVGYNELTLVGNVDVDNVVTKSTIGGNVSQRTAAMVGGATNGDNTVTILYGDVTGNVTLDASWPFAAAGDNSLSVTGFVNPVTGVVTTSDIGGTVSMTASVGSNSMVLNMATIGGGVPVAMTAGTDNTLMVFGANAAGVVTESTIVGSVSMTAGTAGVAFSGSNTAVINIANVTGNVSQTAGVLGGNNSLTVTGVDALNTSDITGSVSQTAAVGDNTLVLDFGTIGAGATMLATLGSNTGVISDSTVTGSISQTAGTFNSLTIDPSTVNGSVTQTAGTYNTLDVLGANVGGVITESLVTGAVSMTAVTGYNDANITMSDVNGSFAQTAGTDNFLDVLGAIDGFSSVQESTIGGAVTMIAGTDVANLGSNTATVTMGNVLGVFSQTAGVLGGNNSLTVLGADASNTSDITGSVNQTAAVGYNMLDLTFATAGDITMNATDASVGYNTGAISDSTVGNITQLAGIYNTLVIDPSTVNGSVSQTAGTYNTLDVLGANVGGVITESLITGAVSMTAVTGYNDANITMSDVGSVTQTAGTYNTLDVLGAMDGTGAIIESSTGAVMMTATTGYNDANITMSDVNGSFAQTAGTDNFLDVLGAIDGFSSVQESTIGGAVTMIAGTDVLNIGNNTATVTMGNVLGAFSQTAGVLGGNNSLTVLGADASNTSDITGSVNQTAAVGDNTLDLTFGTIGAGATMLATLGSNTAAISDSTVTGVISQTAGTFNSLTIDPSMVNGSVSQTAGTYNTLDVLGANAGGVITESLVTGAVSMTAVTGYNDANITMSDVGSVTQNAATNNNLDVLGAMDGTGAIIESSTGAVIMTATTGINDANITMSDVNGSFAQTAGTDNFLDVLGAIDGFSSVQESTIGGAVTMIAGTDVLNIGNNTATVTMGNVLGAFSQTAGVLGGNNSLTVLGADASNTSDITGSVNQTAAVGNNTLTLGFATLGSANLSAVAPVYGNTVTVDDASTITGALNTTSLDDSLTINGDSVLTVGSINTLGGNDNLTVTGTATVVGNVDMGDGDDALNVIAGATLTGNVQASGTKLTVAGVVGGSVTMTASAGSNQLDLNGATVASGVTMSATAGNVSTVNVDGASSITAGGITTGAGDDLVNVDGIVTGNIATAAGNDTLNVNATGIVTGNVDMGDGTDVVNVIAGGTLTGDVQAEGIKLTVTGIVSGAVSMNAAAGSNELDLVGAVIANGVTMAATAGNVSTVNVDAASTITANGITTGAGDDLVNVDGIVTGNIVTAAGNDTLNVHATATITGNIDMGAGDDTLNVFAGSTITGTIDMGDGNNTVNAIGGTMGDITITVTTGSNLLNLVGATTGNITLTTTTGNNDMTLDATATGAGSAVTMTATTGNNTLTLLNAATIGTGGLTMTATTGDNTATITNSTVNGSVTQTSTTGNNVLTLAGASTIATGVTQTASAGFSSTLSVSAASSITAGGITLTGAADGNLTIDGTVGGNVTTSTGADALTINAGGSVTGNINMAAGNDTLTLNVGNASVGTIDMGAGTNTANISVAFDLSDITSTAGDLTIGGASAFTVSAGLGVAGQTTSVTDAAATLTFATSGNTVAGTLNTTAAGNVLDASGIAAGGSLINAAAATSWDVLAVGDADMQLVGNAGFALIGDSVDLVTGHAVDLTNWNTAGISSVSLTVGATTVSLNWNIVNNDYEGVVGANTWTLGDAGNTKLTLGITA
jgi:fibronectin-binding autotransporter adhesin